MNYNKIKLNIYKKNKFLVSITSSTYYDIKNPEYITYTKFNPYSLMFANLNHYMNDLYCG